MQASLICVTDCRTNKLYNSLTKKPYLYKVKEKQKLHKSENFSPKSSFSKWLYISSNYFLLNTLFHFLKISEGENKVKANVSITLQKKWSYQLRISSVNVTKSAVPYGFGHIY